MTGDEIVKAHRAWLTERLKVWKEHVCSNYTEGCFAGMKEALDHLDWLLEAEGDEGLDEVPPALNVRRRRSFTPRIGGE